MPCFDPYTFEYWEDFHEERNRCRRGFVHERDGHAIQTARRGSIDQGKHIQGILCKGAARVPYAAATLAAAPQ